MQHEEATAAALAAAIAQVKSQRALVVDLAKAGQFEQLPRAHHALRKMEDALKQARASHPSA